MIQRLLAEHPDWRAFIVVEWDPFVEAIEIALVEPGARKIHDRELIYWSTEPELKSLWNQQWDEEGVRALLDGWLGLHGLELEDSHHFTADIIVRPDDDATEPIMRPIDDDGAETATQELPRARVS
ncbi:MAG: hypothetical protein SF123_07640 [Chloroflexota bacterium]|nr:hypothetical protein [Chloroflexota bacterium]